jgi:hypothetical protein
VHVIVEGSTGTEPASEEERPGELADAGARWWGTWNAADDAARSHRIAAPLGVG